MASSINRRATRAAAGIRRRTASDLAQFCDDAGISERDLSNASGVARGYVHRILAGEARPSLETYARLALPLGADLSVRFYPNTGPLIRDRHQARIAEALLDQLHPRWHPFTEVAVVTPARGWIDLALYESRESIVVATEIQSELRRLEQLVRWSCLKASALPSWSGWRDLAGGETGAPRISQLLVVRRTRATQAVGRDFERQIRLAFPAHPDDAVAALLGTAGWPGPALIWVESTAATVRLLTGRS
jgi:transcriptional regulator with XRE-family HTH domain